MLIPIILSRIDEGCQHFFKRTIGAFGLTVSLRMVSGTHRECSIESRPEATPEVGSEPRITITQDTFRYAVQSNHFTQEDVGQLRRRHRRLTRNVVYHLRQLVDKYDDGVIARARSRQTRDEIH